MKILHTADTHIGRKTHGSIDQATGVNTRLLEQRRTVRWIYETAQMQGCDLIVHAGDVGDSRNLNGPEVELASRFSSSLSIVGNHDLEWHPRRMPSVSTVSGSFLEPALHVVGGVALLMVPYPSRAVLAATGANVGDAVAEIVAEMLTRCENVDRRYVVAHMSVAGAQYNPAQNPLLMTAQDVTVPVTSLLQDGVDGVILGHIHMQQNIFNTKACYCGSPMALDFGEEGSDKGVLIWDTETGHVEFIVNPHSPRFETIRFESDWDVDLVFEGMAPGTYARVKAEVPFSDATKRRIMANAEQAGVHLCGIVDKREHIVRRGSDKVAKAVTDEDIVREYAAANDMSVEQATAMVDLMKQADTRIGG